MRERRAAAAVVADLHQDGLVCRRQRDACPGRGGMLRGVGETFGDDEIDCRFDRFAWALRIRATDLNGKRGAMCERLEGRFESTVGEYCGVQSSGEVAEFLKCTL